MNIFAVDRDPVLAAQYQCDQHVVKMCTESAQMMCTAFEDAPWKPSHPNHICTRWAMESRANFEWLLEHANALCAEYTRRYSKVHKTQAIVEWVGKKDLSFLPDLPQTEFVQAMPDECKVADDVVQAYHNLYYHKFNLWAQHPKKQYHMRYKLGNVPYFMEELWYRLDD